MKTATKNNLLRAATATAVLCTAALMILPATAFAAPATATGTVNVRSGPGTSFGVVDQLRAGEQVDVRGCRSGWCYVEKSGPDGYISSSYLRRGNGGGTFEPNFNLSFAFPQGNVSIGSGGVSIGIGEGRPDRPNPPPSGGSLPGDVCFYSGQGYTGSRFCMDEGDMTPYVGDQWNNRISSIRNPDGYDVTVCDDAGYDLCRTYRTSARTLGSFDDEISSIRVR
ncbi:MAG TPA: SH3 domain-containing protein [Devosia sp.]|nr:SH3 domain-containing protein [Devosia sp.]